jgi:glucose dehydrogenase
LPSAAAGDWPSYNRTLTSDRYSQLSQINTMNVGKLKVLCTYDVNQLAAFESGLIMVDNALIGTTQFDIFSLNPATCAENWRTHEDYPPSLLPANRGAAYMDGMLFRGAQDWPCSPMTSRPASECGKRQSRTRNTASRCRRLRLLGTASSSSGMRAGTSPERTGSL